MRLLRLYNYLWIQLYFSFIDQVWGSRLYCFLEFVILVLKILIQYTWLGRWLSCLAVSAEWRKMDTRCLVYGPHWPLLLKVGGRVYCQERAGGEPHGEMKVLWGSLPCSQSFPQRVHFGTFSSSLEIFARMSSLLMSYSPKFKNKTLNRGLIKQECIFKRT